MKTSKGARLGERSDALRKATRLDPIRKSGKERHALYGLLREEEEEEPIRPRRESAFDYFDDEEE
ncbi:MAG: hypothetical protein K2N93_05000 [Alistipes sp.]|nr:hypothetical protein [Alistipes sp.]